MNLITIGLFEFSQFTAQWYDPFHRLRRLTEVGLVFFFENRK